MWCPSVLQTRLLKRCVKEALLNSWPGAQIQYIQCFGTFDDEKYHVTDLKQDWRLWLFQVCTEWGYFTVRHPSSIVGFPLEINDYSRHLLQIRKNRALYHA